MKITKHLVLFFTHFLCIVSFSQKQSIKFEHLDINSGLSQNHIMCILQDSRGFMWFGTRDGLNKYDGYKFTIYKNDVNDPGSISNNFITAITEDKRGVIWVATRGGGLNRYDKKKNQFARLINNPEDPLSISSNLVSGMTMDHSGNLWISTEDAGLNYLDASSNRFTRYTYDKNNAQSLSSNNTRYVCEDSEKNIWVGTYDAGLNLLDKKTKVFTHFRHDEKNKGSISSDNVRVLFEDSKRRFWAGTVDGGLDLFDKETGTFLHFSQDVDNKKGIANKVIGALGEDKEGNLWVGTENGGLSIYDDATKTFQLYLHDDIDNKSISHNSIYTIYRDTHGNMWVGTFAGGLNILNRDASRFAHYKHTSQENSLSHNNVLCIEEGRNGKLWIGTDGGGLNLFDPVTKDFTHYVHDAKNKNSISGNYVLDVCEDRKGNIWIGTWANGVTVLNPATNTYRHFINKPGDSTSLSNNNVWAVYEDRDQNLWIGTYGGGLNLYDPVANCFKRFDDTTSSIVVKQVHSITEDNKGNLWIGTDGGGLRIFNKKTNRFSEFVYEEGKKGLSDNRINYVYQDGDNNFWICTMSGLNYYNTKTQEFAVYTAKEGLPNSTIHAIMEDAQGSFWISTNKGISRFNPQTKSFKNFGLSDGLQSYEFKGHSLCKTSKGIMYFGGINGFNEFYPGNVKEDAFEPPLVLTDFMVFNKRMLIAKNASDVSPLKSDITETREITLSHNQSFVSFEFASLNYTVPEKKQYAYMLEGFDGSWNEIGTNRSATYTNLNPGEYIFKVKGLNNEGAWSSRMAEVRIIIKPPFWMTWWFRLAAVLAIAGAVIGFYKYRLRSIKAHQAKLQKLVEEKTYQLQQSTEEEHKARQQTEEANKELERKNKELEQFAYVASHDMQEPLRTTSSFVELLQKQYGGKLDEKADQYLTYVVQSADRMKVLIQDLLDYSRIGRHQELKKVDCNQLMKEMLTDLDVAVKETNADISYEKLPVIKGYPTEIKLLFQNLVINAIKFRKKDVNPEIRICAGKSNGYWEFLFADNGIGIDEKHNERIFVIFQRLHNRNEYKGSGIGLAHCKKIVELHGGKIWFESKPGGGTTFRFTIREK